ncbi:hypothetical protein LRK_02115 [Lacticaseibacillus rhamnosus K32]|uniref:hypothetical protein n=1 Tax=Lacticaseibacillus rhamnosus TaxID=47715 RepID=UPI0004E2BBAF|nr:hypothetical protein [Lacticaseibacillus rhamnosus]KFC37831.1 hypothetical protein LRK_02115 [Lacticaseibacillus rhamnosus K32]KMO45230.1 hypothetical protein PY97_12950 [Lacticaseibacillus rhamnosus]MCT3171853.1 hypothetical protein [Lacticaseibacillus rhamnosus]MCT3180260.1 hypothetical protein [Lacticaseibacillus rhamnosus]
MRANQRLVWVAVLIGIVAAAPATITHADEKTSVAHVRILVEPMSDPKIVKVVTPDSPGDDRLPTSRQKPAMADTSKKKDTKPAKLPALQEASYLITVLAGVFFWLGLLLAYYLHQYRKLKH